VDRARVVLLELPRLLQEIVERAVGGQPDMEIVADLPTARTLPAALAEARADVVISGAGHDSAELSDLLEERSRLKVLAVSNDGRDAVLYELRPVRTPLGELSPRTIVEAIRSARRATS
jgi:DNA-binding NarL/FixJ family response regulator